MPPEIVKAFQAQAKVTMAIKHIENLIRVVIDDGPGWTDVNGDMLEALALGSPLQWATQTHQSRDAS